MRTINHNYQDPLDVVWVHAANRLGMKIRRDDSVFATWDGKGVLKIGTRETLDPDDSLAQMILHEICHWLVEGNEAFEREDWGLVYDNVDHAVHEHACLRLQAGLADQVGLRRFFGSTTDFREYFDQLSDDPLFLHSDAGELDRQDAAVSLAVSGYVRAGRPPFKEVLTEALNRTRDIANVVDGIAPSDSLWGLGR